MSEPRSARQFQVLGPGRGAVVEVPLAPPGPGEVRIRALRSGVSRGTEALVFRGEVPPSQYREMRAPFQQGDFPGPVAYGYMSVGVVEAAGPGPGEALLGRRVFCLYPHQDRYVVPADAVVPVPDAVPTERAVLAANAETAVNVVWDAAPSVGDRILVVGAGVVGLLVSWLCARIPGARVRAVDPKPSRRAPASALGVELGAEPDADDGDADVVVHASGSPDGLRTALEQAGVEALVVEASWYGTRDVRLPLGEAFHARRITLRGSQVGRVPPARAPRWSHGRRLALALELLADPALDVLLTGSCAFEELPGVLARLATDPGETLCQVVRYPDD